MVQPHFPNLSRNYVPMKLSLKTWGIHNSNSPNFRHSYESRGRDFKQQSFQRKPTKFNASDAARNPQRCFNCNDIGHLSKSCPNHSRGPRCLSCNLYGHKSFECRRANLNNTSTPPSGVNAVHELSSPINMCKDVTIFGRKLNRLVDTGNNLTLLRNSTYINIDAPPLKQTNTLLTGFGFSRINVIGTFDSEITIDDQIFPVTISVVPNSCTNYDLIIGCDVIKQAHLNVSPTGVKFAQILKSNNCYRHIRLKKTKTVNIEFDIALTNDEPIFHKPRRLPFAERDIVDAQVDEWVKNGIVEPCSSPYASQVVVVKKKDGKSRVFIDYRRLNRKLIKDNYPLPLIDDILDCLQNAKIFTTLDLKNGFFHVAVNERSRKFTSFVTHNGQYQFRRMPFGLSTCPSTFMRYINAMFRHLISKSIVLPYMDDVVIPAANESQALEYLKIVLEVACDYGLEINFKKCQFLRNKIEFLGHIIENGRLLPSPSKTKAVINYPDLKNIKDVRRFLGLTDYFRKFLTSYSTIAKPLSDLLRKDSLFQFYAEQTAFQKLKYLLSQQPVLSIFNQNSPTEIHTDASIDGLGAVLLQKSIHDNQFHPVFYMSKKTSDHERKYISFELEVLAVVEALKKFRIYVLGTSFKIITDCDALVKALSKKELNPRIARWALYLQEFNYTIVHRTGSKMAHVDALSRPPHCMLIQNSVHLQFLKAQQADDKITTIKTLLETTPHDNYIVKNKLLYKTVNGTDLLVVPDEMQANIIKTAHERGHFAVLRTQDLVNKDFYIPRLKYKVEKCIQNCVTCILTNRKRVIDAFSKFTWLYPTRSTDAAEVINRLENQRHVFGNPARIITDKGSAFTSSAFEDYCKKQNILHISITTGLPRSNGQIEKQNSTIIAVLSKLSIDDPEKWYSHVPHLQEILNSTFQRSIKMTPFELLFGTKMKSCQDIEIVELLNDETTAQFQENNVMLSVKMPKSKSTKFKMRIAARTISDADKFININYMT
ncbi:transposon Tf2-6 polyprotein [Trichonephila clavipes]|nr:transposon Tf2-6 polyprotein [Trichonephila clavipes]